MTAPPASRFGAEEQSPTPPDPAGAIGGGPTSAARPGLKRFAFDRAALLRLLAFLPAALFLLTILAPPLNHDVAAVLNFAERWFAGERLYRDLIDVNPPLIFALNLIPAALAALTPLEGVGALLICLLGLVLLCWRLSAALRRGRAEGPVEQAVLAAAIPLVMLIAGYDFGQREHLMALVAIPYCVLAARRIEGAVVARRLVLGTAVLAAIGFALKPHFLAVPLLVEALVLLRRGPRAALRDAVPWTMASVWIAYLAAIPLIFPDYFAQVVPLVWAYYTELGVFSPWGVLRASQLGTVLLVLLALLPAAFLSRGARALEQSFALAALGAFLAAWVQHKGWTYHATPVIMLAAAAAVTLAASRADRALPPPRAIQAAPALALAATVLLGLFAVRGGEAPWRQFSFSEDRSGRLTAWLRREAHGERLLVLSPDMYPVYPAVVYARATTTLRTMNLWLLQGVYRECRAGEPRYRQTWEMSRAEFFVYRTVAEDFARAPPSAVLVASQTGIPSCRGRFDFIAYFSRHPLFAETWLRYRLTGEIEGYRLYVREN